MKTARILTILLLALAIMVCSARVTEAAPMGTAFTYQGHLYDNNDVANDFYDFEFKLYDAVEDGNQLGVTVAFRGVDVIEGYFAVELDFEAGVFDGDARWLEIGVKPGGSSELFNTLSLRQELTPAPYSIYAQKAGADDDWQVSGDDMSSIPSGNVGIGTNIASTKLDVVGTVTATAFVGDGSGLTGIAADSDWTVDGNDMYSIPSGNVGIGTSVPLSRLSAGGEGFVNTGVYGNGSDYGVYGNSSTDGVFGRGGYSGVHGRDDDSGSFGRLGHDTYGVYGSGTVYGGYFLGKGYFSGDVGIGMTVPGSRLDIKAANQNSTGGLRLTSSINDNKVIHLQDSSPGDQGQISVRAGGSNKIVLRANGDSYFDGGNVGIGTTSPSSDLQVNGNVDIWTSSSTTSLEVTNTGSNGWGVHGHSNYSIGIYGSSNGYWGVKGENSNTGNHGTLGSSQNGVYGTHAGSGNSGSLGSVSDGVRGSSSNGNGVYGSSSTGYAGYFSGDVFVEDNCSAQSFTDRTPYPKDLATAYQAVMSMEPLPDGQYDENNREVQLDHSKLSDFIRSKDGNRNLSATVSCLNEVVKDLVRKVEDQHRLIKIQNTQIQQMAKQLKINKQPQAVIMKGAVQ